MRRFILLFLLLSVPGYLLANVVKPSLAEIRVFDGQVQTESYARNEVLFAGIYADYKNTQDSPRAGVQSEISDAAIEPFEPVLSQKIRLKTGNRLAEQDPFSERVFSYMRIGFESIVPKGSGHMLFILGIFLLGLKLRPLFSQVIVFTIAHTITLGLSANGIVSLPGNIVQPLIALSVAYVGVGNILTPTLHKRRLLLIFVFGLLHGLSFASVFKNSGMPANSFVTALISFNVGVELGQITVITMAFFALGVWFKDRPWYREVVIVPCSFIISIVALYWMLGGLELFQ